MLTSSINADSAVGTSRHCKCVSSPRLVLQWWCSSPADSMIPKPIVRCMPLISSSDSNIEARGVGVRIRVSEETGGAGESRDSVCKVEVVEVIVFVCAKYGFKYISIAY